jgi:hypothetical protein
MDWTAQFHRFFHDRNEYEKDEPQLEPWSTLHSTQAPMDRKIYFQGQQGGSGYDASVTLAGLLCEDTTCYLPVSLLTVSIFLHG